MAVQFHIFNCISLSYQKVSRESTIVADSSTYYWCRKTAELLVKGIINDAGMGYKIIGLLEDNCVRNGILKRFPVLGKFSDVEAVILKTGVQHVFIAAPGLEQEKLTRLIYKVQPLVKNMGIIPNLVGIPMGGIEVESFFYEKLMLLRLKNNLAISWNRYLKTIFDFALTLLVL